MDRDQDDPHRPARLSPPRPASTPAEVVHVGVDVPRRATTSPSCTDRARPGRNPGPSPPTRPCSSSGSSPSARRSPRSSTRPGPPASPRSPANPGRRVEAARGGRAGRRSPAAHAGPGGQERPARRPRAGLAFAQKGLLAVGARARRPERGGGRPPGRAEEREQLARKPRVRAAARSRPRSCSTASPSRRAWPAGRPAAVGCLACELGLAAEMRILALDVMLGELARIALERVARAARRLEESAKADRRPRNDLDPAGTRLGSGRSTALTSRVELHEPGRRSPTAARCRARMLGLLRAGPAERPDAAEQGAAPEVRRATPGRGRCRSRRPGGGSPERRRRRRRSTVGWSPSTGDGKEAIVAMARRLAILPWRMSARRRALSGGRMSGMARPATRKYGADYGHAPRPSDWSSGAGRPRAGEGLRAR